MAVTRIQSDQVVNETTLDEIQPVARTQISTLSGQINTRFSEPGKLTITGGVLTVGPTIVQTHASGKKKGLPQLGGVDLGTLTGTYNFSTAAVTGDVVTTAVPSLTANFFYRAGIEIRTDKTIRIVYGTGASTSAAAGKPSFLSTGLPKGEVLLQANVGGTAFVTPIASSITEFGSGAGGSGGGASNQVSQATHGFTVGNWLRHNGITYSLADIAGGLPAVGVVSNVIDTNTFVVTTGGFVSGLPTLAGGGGALYYLSTSGTITINNQPIDNSAVNFQQAVFSAVSATSGYVVVGPQLYDAQSASNRDGFVSQIAQSWAGIKTFVLKVIASRGTEVPNAIITTGTEIITTGTTRIVGRLTVASPSVIQVDGDLHHVGALLGTGLLTGNGVITSV